MSPDDPRHGERRGYYAHRVAGEAACDPCKRAAAAAEQRYVLARMEGRPMRRRAEGTQRRLRALQAMGWTLSEIAQQLGEQRTCVEKWCNEDRTYVYSATAHRVEQVYDRLCMTVPSGPWAARNRRMAARKGYAPPLAWDDIDDPAEIPSGVTEPVAIDEVVVERILAGDVTVRATLAERRQVCRRWHASGRSLAELARLTGWRVDRYFRVSDHADAA